jgi:hypothetical protein
LGDKESRENLLAVTPDLRKRNFVESTAEELSKGIGIFRPGHNAAEPRHAFNKFKFQLPASLPLNGGPGELINEVHSFGMVFNGCFWDLIANLFEASGPKSEASLHSAAKLAGKILIEGAKAAVVTPRFLQSVGRAMVLADQSLHGGANTNHIRSAFQNHDILLGSNAMLAPSMTLAGSAPKRAALGAATRRDLARRLDGGRGQKMSMAAANVFGTRAVQVVHTRNVPLGNLDKRLKGVVAVAHEPVLVGASGGRASVLGVMPQAEDTELEVQTFVASLLQHDRIELAKPRKRAFAATTGDERATHAIRTVGGKKVLRRIRFRCTCCALG